MTDNRWFVWHDPWKQGRSKIWTEARSREQAEEFMAMAAPHYPHHQYGGHNAFFGEMLTCNRPPRS